MLGAVNCQAPEVMRTGLLSKQADVYAFGMLGELPQLLLAAATTRCCGLYSSCAFYCMLYGHLLAYSQAGSAEQAGVIDTHTEPLSPHQLYVGELQATCAIFC
jgi:hypothetical protein